MKDIITVFTEISPAPLGASNAYESASRSEGSSAITTNNYVPPQGHVAAPEMVELDPIEERGFTASTSILGKLLQFWIGWNVLPRHKLDINVVESNFPTSSSCFHQLKLPGHYKEYCNFERDLLAAIHSNDTGFGLV
ncbi:hypothetical protein EYF80_022190 [Liparis tanakae]|uniref:HECT domain-containing protein n=1 Tax=Liparis tanakae TaxID=230148 RepID=A0A4Z2HPX0_9TELE|nr:hypothetical protein EYF80_022190 [Liparis tanakae]